ncbi:MAG: DNA-directed RNA polymerase subunit D, partial [bacterium]
ETNPQFANALRRIMMVEIPNMAVETVDFSSNNSSLYDETIAHRLAMIPILFDQKKYNLKDECKCEGKGCSLCEIVFVVNKKGPGIVYSKDMKSSDPEAKPFYDNIPIVELADDESIKFEAVASLGTGRDHAKFNTAIAFHRYYPTIEVSGLKNADECVKSCPRNALDIKGNTASVKMKCDLCQECVRTANPQGSIKIFGDKTKFIIDVESISALTAEQIVMSAVEILKDRAHDLEKEIKKLK